MALVLTELDVRALVSMDDLIEAMASALAAFSAGDVRQPLRGVLPVGEGARFLGVMPAWVPGASALGAKLVTVSPTTSRVGLPTHRATVVLIDPENGGLLAVMDGRYLTEARTAAVSAVSAKHLARRARPCSPSWAPGCRRAATSTRWRASPDLAEVRVWSPTAAHREAFAAEMAANVSARVRAVATAGAAARGVEPHRAHDGRDDARAVERGRGRRRARLRGRRVPAGPARDGRRARRPRARVRGLA